MYSQKLFDCINWLSQPSNLALKYKVYRYLHRFHKELLKEDDKTSLLVYKALYAHFEIAHSLIHEDGLEPHSALSVSLAHPYVYSRMKEAYDAEKGELEQMREEGESEEDFILYDLYLKCGFIN